MSTPCGFSGVAYCGLRGQQGATAWVKMDASTGSTRRHLLVRLDLRSHSPCGFEWGYQGSGPSQLALAICCDALRDDKRAEVVYQAFKREVVAGWSENSFTITRDDVLAFVQKFEAARERAI